MDSEDIIDGETLYVDECEKYKNCYDDALKLLNTNIEVFTSSSYYGIVNIIPYSINKCGQYPFDFLNSFCLAFVIVFFI